jgi:hypothetical protein
MTTTTINNPKFPRSYWLIIALTAALTLLALLLNGCIKEDYNIIPITIEGDSTYISIVDSSKININVDNDNVNTNTNDNKISIVDSTVINNAKTNDSPLCVEMPLTPVIVGILQPTHESPYIGSVIIGGLPTTLSWTLIRFPDKVITMGTGNSTTVIGLDSQWASQNGAKCYSTKYYWYVINECGHISPISATAEIKSHE